MWVYIIKWFFLTAMTVSTPTVSQDTLYRMDLSNYSYLSVDTMSISPNPIPCKLIYIDDNDFLKYGDGYAKETEAGYEYYIYFDRSHEFEDVDYTFMYDIVDEKEYENLKYSDDGKNIIVKKVERIWDVIYD